MADNLTARDDGGSFLPAPEGQWQAVCVDVIDLGQRAESFQGGPARLTHKVAFVFQLTEINPETQKPFEIGVEKTLAMSQNAGLRKFLGMWRGRAYSDAEAKVGVPLARLVGVNAIVQIEHRVSGQGRNYAKLMNIMPPLRGMPKLAPQGYERSKHWQDRRAQYAAEIAAMMRDAGAPAPAAEPANFTAPPPVRPTSPALTAQAQPRRTPAKAQPVVDPEEDRAWQLELERQEREDAFDQAVAAANEEGPPPPDEVPWPQEP